MTLSDVHFAKQVDPIINLAATTKVRIEEGAKTVTKTKFTTNNVSVSNIQFNNINPPSAEIVVDRKIHVRFPFRLTFTGSGVAIGNYLLSTPDPSTDLGLGPLVGSTDALRAFPLSQMVQSMRVKINSSEYTQTLNDYIEPVMRYSNFRDIAQEDWSATPTMQDTYQNYNDYTIYGSALNPLGSYGENGFRTPRGGFAGVNIISQKNLTTGNAEASTATTDIMEAEVDIEVCEPLFISPLAFGKKSYRGFYGVNTMQLTLNLDSNYAARVWSHNNATGNPTIDNIVMSFGTSTPGFASNPEIMFNYLTPRQSLEMPNENIYPYHRINDYITDTQTSVASGASSQITINNIQLDSVPKRVYIYFRKKKADKTFNDTDTYARITGINVNFANNDGLLSGANEYQLYLMSVRSGLKSSWSEWSKYVGSVLCLDFARDITMDSQNVVGKAGTYQIQYTANVTNLSSAAINYDAHTVIVNDGYISIDDKTITTMTSLGDVSDLFGSPAVDTVDWEDMEMFYGAGFVDTIKSLGSKAVSVYKKALPGLKKALGKIADNADDRGDLELSRAARAFEKGGIMGAIKEVGPEIVRGLIQLIPKYGDDLGAVAADALHALGSAELLYGSGAVGGGIVGGGIVGGASAPRKKMLKSLKRY